MHRDLSQSRAILISSATYRDQRIPDLPAAAGCIPAMRDLLISGLCGWPGDRVTSFQDVPGPPELAVNLHQLVKDTRDVLVLYYVGHGMRTTRGQLALGLRDSLSDPELAPHTAITYEAIAHILGGSPATTKLVILDCCHAELANKATYQFQSPDIEPEFVDGVYFIGASKQWEKAKSPLDGGLPYFTDAFIQVVRNGVQGRPPQLSIDHIFTALRSRLLQAGLPEPVKGGLRDAERWPFAFNAAPQETHRDPEQVIVQLEAEVARLQALASLASLASRAEMMQKGREIQYGIPGAGRQPDGTAADLAEGQTQTINSPWFGSQTAGAFDRGSRPYSRGNEQVFPSTSPATAPGARAAPPADAWRSPARGPRAAPALLVRTERDTHRLVSGQEYRIGRDEQVDIPLVDARVSWEHAVLRTEGPAWVLEDRGSRNGIFLGSKRIMRLEISKPYVVHLGHPEDGPVLRFELSAPEGDGAAQAPVASVMKIGRRPDNDIVVSDLGVSKQHAELRLSPTGRYQIIDMGSHNGTFVNGCRVNQANLDDGDIISIGHARFRLIGGELIEYINDLGPRALEARDILVMVSDGGKQKVLLDRITFLLAERSMMAVIGPAGAGKSTLLNALAGKRPPTVGSVFYDSRDLYENYGELRHRIGVVSQQLLFPSARSSSAWALTRRVASRAQQTVAPDRFTPRTALERAADLLYPDLIAGERKHLVGEILTELSMARYANTRIDQLPVGQQRYLNIGLAAMAGPYILFLDDPTSALDPHLKRKMFLQLRKLADRDAKDGQSVILATHDVESKLLDHCDRLIVLQPGGKMAFFGPPADGLRYFGREDWADVFRAFAEEPERDFAAEYRASPHFQKYVATPIAIRQRLDAELPRATR